METDIPTQDFSKLPVDNYQPFLHQEDQSDRAGLVRELSPTNAIIDAIDRLRGVVRNPRNPTDIRKINTIINEDGIAIFTLIVTAGANEINTFSNYRTEDKLISKIMEKWIKDIVYEFYYHRKKYEIPEESQASMIVNLAVGLILPSFFKALGAGDRNAATRSVSESIVRAMRSSDDSQQPQARRGLFSRMNPFSNG